MLHTLTLYYMSKNWFYLFHNTKLYIGNICCRWSNHSVHHLAKYCKEQDNTIQCKKTQQSMKRTVHHSTEQWNKNYQMIAMKWERWIQSNVTRSEQCNQNNELRHFHRISLTLIAWYDKASSILGNSLTINFVTHVIHCGAGEIVSDDSQMYMYVQIIYDKIIFID